MKNPIRAISDWRNKPLLTKREQKKYRIIGTILGPFIGLFLLALGIAPIAALLAIFL